MICNISDYINTKMKMIKAHLLGESVLSNSEEAFALYKKSNFGEPVGEKIQYSSYEAIFLIEKKKMELIHQKKNLLKEDLLNRFKKKDKKIETKYIVFKDLREKGYIVKTALKFGAEFRVYEKGHHPGKKHAKWILFTDDETKKLSWHEFASKNRVAHSTRKKLLIAIVDSERGIIYYETNWIKP